MFGIAIFLITIIECRADNLNQNPFPKEFVFGTSTSAYQIEGAWNLNGKGENIWDKFTHDQPQRIYNGQNADVACDSYHKYKEDIQLAANLKLDSYRFSISWTRILPTGYTNKINPDGIRYYNALIDGLLSRGIQPLVTIYHWDLPTSIQEIGGWPSSAIIDYFVDFARIAFKYFGDRVKMWITFNEPKQFCREGYGAGMFAPQYNSSGIGDYLCVYNLLIAHALVYRMYQEQFKAKQNGLIGFTMNSNWGEPNTTSKADIEAADRFFEFQLGIFANPIYGSGDYPNVVKQFVAKRSKKQGFQRSRLPMFTKDDIYLVKGSADFFGLNIYTANIVSDGGEADLGTVSWSTDSRVNYWQDDNWQGAASPGLKVVPWGMRKMLVKIKEKYGNVPIYITENGYSDLGTLNDTIRINYILTYLSNVLDAMYNNKVNVKGYFYWSLLDNFEWNFGYRPRFGLHHVDFESPNRTRSEKQSAGVYRNVILSRKLPRNTVSESNRTKQRHNKKTKLTGLRSKPRHHDKKK